MEMPPDARRRIAEDHVVWLTTVTDSGFPAPNPVWFVPDGGELLVFAAPDSRKVHNIERRPRVALHFNSDSEGGDGIIITADATLTYDRPPSALRAYLDKYESSITGPLGMTVEEVDRTYNTEIRIRPRRVRLTSG